MNEINPSFLIAGVTPRVGATTAAKLFASALSGTYRSFESDIEFGQSGSDVYDLGVVDPFHRNVVLVVKNRADHADIAAGTEAAAAVFVMWDETGPLSPWETAVAAGLPLAGFVTVNQTVADATESGLIDVGIHSAADLKLSPVLIEQATEII